MDATDWQDIKDIFIVIAVFTGIMLTFYGIYRLVMQDMKR